MIFKTSISNLVRMTRSLKNLIRYVQGQNIWKPNNLKFTTISHLYVFRIMNWHPSPIHQEDILNPSPWSLMGVKTRLNSNQISPRKEWIYQMGNQNPYIEEEYTNTMAKRKSTKEQTTIYKTYI